MSLSLPSSGFPCRETKDEKRQEKESETDFGSLHFLNSYVLVFEGRANRSLSGIEMVWRVFPSNRVCFNQFLVWKYIHGFAVWRGFSVVLAAIKWRIVGGQNSKRLQFTNQASLFFLPFWDCCLNSTKFSALWAFWQAGGCRGVVVVREHFFSVRNLSGNFSGCVHCQSLPQDSTSFAPLILHQFYVNCSN